MNFAPSSLPLIIPIMPVGYPSKSRTWWNCLPSIQLYMMNLKRATSLCYAQPTHSHWRQRTSRVSTATQITSRRWWTVWYVWWHRYDYTVHAYRSWFCAAHRWIREGSGANEFTHRTSWGITLFTTTLHQRCGEFLECDPFLETGNELIAIDTRAVIEHEVVMSLGQIQEVDEPLHESYVQARIL